jgi:hypothetical protein
MCPMDRRCTGRRCTPRRSRTGTRDRSSCRRSAAQAGTGGMSPGTSRRCTTTHCSCTCTIRRRTPRPTPIGRSGCSPRRSYRPEAERRGKESPGNWALRSARCHSRSRRLGSSRPCHTGSPARRVSRTCHRGPSSTRGRCLPRADRCRRRTRAHCTPTRRSRRCTCCTRPERGTRCSKCIPEAACTPCRRRRRCSKSQSCRRTRRRGGSRHRAEGGERGGGRSRASAKRVPCQATGARFPVGEQTGSVPP